MRTNLQAGHEHNHGQNYDSSYVTLLEWVSITSWLLHQVVGGVNTSKPKHPRVRVMSTYTLHAL